MGGRTIDDQSRSAVFSDPSSGVPNTDNNSQFILNTFVAPPSATFGQITYTLNTVRNPSKVIYAGDGVLDPEQGYTHQDIWNLGGATGIWSAPVSMWTAQFNPERGDDPVGTRDVVEAAGGDGDFAYRAQSGSGVKVVFLDGHVAVLKKGTMTARNLQPGFP